MTEPKPEPEPGPVAPTRRGGLFTRILLTFVVTALASAIVAGIAGFTFARQASSEWIVDARAALDAVADELHDASEDRQALAEIAARVSTELDSPVGVYSRRGKRIAGDGPPAIPRRSLGRRALRSGQPVVFHRPERFAPPGVVYALPDPKSGRVAAFVAVVPRPGFRLLIPAVSVALTLLVLGIGAGILSRSLTRRLARLEASANRIASGDLQHRIALDNPTPADEIDELGQTFNTMAGKLEGLISGQRTLLANVSHELRTPIARMKVLVEILAERADALRARGETSRPLQRIEKGLGDLGEDITEVETLISDLLTSGRLELRHGNTGALMTSAVEIDGLLSRVAPKVGAQIVDGGELPTLDADELLLERMLSNLLANARRACPDGTITVGGRVDGSWVEIAVEDEGPGVAAEHRETIFEPFTRLDAARDRDRGGVGLGLYLCRQICASHGGSIEVRDRTDGRSGARFVVRLPTPAAA